MRDNYVLVPSKTAEKWFVDGNLDVVKDAVFAYIENHPNLFSPDGDVILDAIEMSDLVLAREELGIPLGQVQEELFVGIIPRQVGTITRQGDEKPAVLKNSVVIGNAGEISNTVLSAFRTYYKMEESHEGHQCDENCRHEKTAKQRADERRKKRKKDKRRGS